MTPPFMGSRSVIKKDLKKKNLKKKDLIKDLKKKDLRKKDLKKKDLKKKDLKEKMNHNEKLKGGVSAKQEGNVVPLNIILF
jgi:hypothetical protein